MLSDSNPRNQKKSERCCLDTILFHQDAKCISNADIALQFNITNVPAGFNFTGYLFQETN